VDNDTVTVQLLKPTAGGTSAVPDPLAALIDRRVLAFRPPALIAAMECVGKQLGLRDEEDIVSVAFQPKLTAISFSLLDGAATREKVVGGSDLAGLLIAYCVSTSVPLPSRASKTVTVLEHGVMLDMIVSYRKPPHRRS
jgi:hypothetical protein